MKKVNLSYSQEYKCNNCDYVVTNKFFNMKLFANSARKTNKTCENCNGKMVLNKTYITIENVL